MVQAVLRSSAVLGFSVLAFELAKKSVTSRPVLEFSPVSMKRYENTVLWNVSEQVFNFSDTGRVLRGLGSS